MEESRNGSQQVSGRAQMSFLFETAPNSIQHILQQLTSLWHLKMSELFQQKSLAIAFIVSNVP